MGPIGNRYHHGRHKGETPEEEIEILSEVYSGEEPVQKGIRGCVSTGVERDTCVVVKQGLRRYPEWFDTT